MNNRLKTAYEKISLTGKITLMYAIVFSLVFVITSSFVLINTVYVYMNVGRDELIETAQIIGKYIESGQKLTNNNLKEMRINKNTNIRVSNINNPAVALAQTSEYSMVLHLEKGWHDKHRKTNVINFRREIRENYMFYQSIHEYKGNTYVVDVYRPYRHLQRILALSGAVFLVANVFGIMGTFSIGRYVSHSLLKPIVTISQAAGRISIEDLSQRIEVIGPDDEIRKLTITFNDMIERLENSFKKQNRFIADASHELRTPISVIQGYANLIDRWGKSDPEILQESIDSIKAETEHMGELVKKLLFLAKNDQNKRGLQLGSITLNKLVLEIVKEADIVDKPCDLIVIENASVEITGDYGLIKQVLWIFIENSLKYCKEEVPRVCLEIFKDGNTPCISVKDNGIGISDEDVKHIFERFYRADKSRNKEIPGTGLGLAIADWIIKQHRAEVEINTKLGRGTEIIIRFEGK